MRLSGPLRRTPGQYTLDSHARKPPKLRQPQEQTGTRGTLPLLKWDLGPNCLRLKTDPTIN